MILLLTLCSGLPAASNPGERGVIYLVRHAEKSAGVNDPVLDEAGQQRARELASLLGDAGIDVIYSTDFNRTRDTAAPLARQLGLEIHIYDGNRMADLAADMTQQGGRYLVVGHSDTTPELVGLLGGEPGPPIDEAGEYDRLYVVSVGANGVVLTELRRYGSPFIP